MISRTVLGMDSSSPFVTAADCPGTEGMGAFPGACSSITETDSVRRFDRSEKDDARPRSFTNGASMHIRNVCRGSAVAQLKVA